MAEAIYRIKSFRRLIQPRHTAYKTKRGHPVCPHRGRPREFATKGDKPPPTGGTVPLGGLLGVLTSRAADFACLRRIGRSFSVFRHSVGCRSPPLLGFGLSKFPENGGAPNGET